MANPRVAWGIDIGNRALKAVKLVRTGDGVRIDDYDLIEHENLLSNAGDNRETLIQTALALFQSKHNLKGLPAAVGVSGQQSFARFIKLPPVEEKQVPQIVKFEAIQQIPFPLDEVEWSYQLFRDEESPDIEVGIFAMRKELVNQHLAYFTASGVNVQAVQMNPLAVYNALAFDEKLKGTTMIIDLGAENADLLIAEGEGVWMRSIPIGGNHFTEALVRDFKLRFERAEELKRTTATSPHGRRILQSMRPVFADLVSEIQRSIGFYSSTHRESRIARVIALGGTFKLPGLQKYLQQNLSLEVHKLDSIGGEPPTDGKLAAALSENALSSASAYGLALQALGAAKITSSLLPQAIQKERMWQDKVKYFAAAAAAIVVGAGIAFGVLQMENSSFTQTEGDRSEIDSVISDAQAMASRFKAIAGTGGEARDKIKEMNGLTEYRGVWPTLLAEIDAAIPTSTAAATRPAASTTRPAGAGTRPAATRPVAIAATQPFNGPPRGDRKEVKLEDMEVQYEPAMGPLVEKDASGRFLLPDSQFNLRAGQRDPAAMAGLLSRRADGGIGGVGAPGAVGIPQPYSVDPDFAPEGPGAIGPTQYTPDEGAPVDPAAAGAGGKRGYLLTLHLTTPNKDGIKFISSTVVGKLQSEEQKRQAMVDAVKKQLEAQGKQGPLPKVPYSIARITISSAQQLKYDAARQQALIARAQAALLRKQQAQPTALEVPGGTGGRLDIRGFVPEGETEPYQPDVPGLPPGLDLGLGLNTQDPAAAAAALAQALLVDPITQESIQEDWEMTVLVAVVLDPFAAPPAPPPEAAPTEEYTEEEVTE